MTSSCVPFSTPSPWALGRWRHLWTLPYLITFTVNFISFHCTFIGCTSFDSPVKETLSHIILDLQCRFYNRSMITSSKSNMPGSILVLHLLALLSSSALFHCINLLVPGWSVYSYTSFIKSLWSRILDYLKWFIIMSRQFIVIYDMI